MRSDLRAGSVSDGCFYRRLRWYIVFIHSMPTGNWAVEDVAEWRTRPFYAWTLGVRPEVEVRLLSTFLSSNSHLNALRIHQLEQESHRLDT